MLKLQESKGSIKNLNNSVENAKSDFEEASRNYANAVEKESNNEHLSPKEKAIHLLDSITDLLKSFGSSADKVNSKLSELKELLMRILKIASDQSKSFTAEYLNKKDRAEEAINKAREDKKIAETKLEDLNSQRISISNQLESQISIQTNIDNQLQEMDSNKSFVSNELRNLEKEINDLRLELRTHEINLENASMVLEKAEVSISDLDSAQYKGMDLKGLEVSLDEIQKNIAQLGSVNLAAPEEYLSRENELKKLIEEAEIRKSEIQVIMDGLVEKSSQAESELTAIRQKQSQFNESLRDLETQKNVAELDLKSITEKVTNLRLDLKTHEINLDNANTKIKEAGLNIENIDYLKYEDMELNVLQDSLADIQAKIIRLGAINLAAPEEIAAESKRKEELDVQYNDLTEALEKLTGAIKTIDLETKTRFQDSFDSINKRMKEVFSKLFGGGFAELALTENDALNAGVVIMARPPGKKNSSISQLSGGEKALTALALVFAIFELNPAPFCILDEVDAPLDDLNTMRFINMVEEMSKTVQFIFITHNKVSMEKSDHLMGVTMQEAGVSRMVSVDVNQALEFAEV
jgi:chromosome segregation protein